MAYRSGMEGYMCGDEGIKGLKRERDRGAMKLRWRGKRMGWRGKEIGLR